MIDIRKIRDAVITKTNTVRACTEEMVHGFYQDEIIREEGVSVFRSKLDSLIEQLSSVGIVGKITVPGLALVRLDEIERIQKELRELRALMGRPRP